MKRVILCFFITTWIVFQSYLQAQTHWTSYCTRYHASIKWEKYPAWAFLTHQAVKTWKYKWWQIKRNHLPKITKGLFKICPTGHQYNVIILHAIIFILVIFTFKNKKKLITKPCFHFWLLSDEPQYSSIIKDINYLKSERKWHPVIQFRLLFSFPAWTN